MQRPAQGPFRFKNEIANHESTVPVLNLNLSSDQQHLRQITDLFLDGHVAIHKEI